MRLKLKDGGERGEIHLGLEGSCRGTGMGENWDVGKFRNVISSIRLIELNILFQ